MNQPATTRKQRILAYAVAVFVVGFLFVAFIINKPPDNGQDTVLGEPNGSEGNKNSKVDVSKIITGLKKIIDEKDDVIRSLKEKAGAPTPKDIKDTKDGQCKNSICNTKEKRVVSFGLYGSDSRYTTGAIHNTELVKYIMPGWVTRFYVDGSVPKDVISKLKDNGAEIVEISDIKGGIAGMFWRFLVADDENVDRYIIRDADSRLSMRERMAVEEWIDSGKHFHVLRDHPNHNFNMNGGLWGGVKGALGSKMSELVKQWKSKDAYLADMEFLGSVVWPIVEKNHMAHGSYHCERYPDTIPFPTRRVNKEIIGGVYDDQDRPREGDSALLTEVPLKCRKHPDYIYG
ncbi:3-phosphoshikimate 1-carboxyvinyltransferase [Acrasis kona]|uniref:3-phosphoshikimate 1-carboxyvinyltransferase n=1 Tax=Acrasis kona TaxID=1008807 RepID=A0AAW2YRT9_9EUKA